MNKNIEDLLMKNGDDFKEEILKIVMNVSHLMDESHVYDTLEIIKEDRFTLARFVENENEYYLALGYLMAKNDSEFWKTVLGK